MTEADLYRTLAHALADATVVMPDASDAASAISSSRLERAVLEAIDRDVRHKLQSRVLLRGSLEDSLGQQCVRAAFARGSVAGGVCGLRGRCRYGFPLLPGLLSALAAHFQSNHVYASLLASPWFLNFFVHQLLPGGAAACVGPALRA